MVAFRDVLASAAESDAFIARTGGLPEITQAAAALRSAIDQTRAEIADAEFASHIGTDPDRITDMLRVDIDAGRFGPVTKAAVAEEGEAGLKRTELRSKIDTIDGDLSRILSHLLMVRTDLVVSQQGFDIDRTADEHPADS